MTFVSLFAGIGGMDLGFERAGLRCVGQVEIDPFCRKVLAKHWPDVLRWDDVRTFMGEGFEHPDVICGGFPCQDISNAGKQVGIDGERSGLWSEYARIVRALRPRCVVVENVAALLNRGLERVLGDLAACGYDAEWDCIPAAAVGAPHRRDRLFLVAYPNSQRLEELHPATISTGTGFDYRPRSPSADSVGQRCGTRGTRGTAGADAWQKDSPALADAKSGRRDATSQPQARGSREADAIAGPKPPIAFGGRNCVAPSQWWVSEPGLDRVVDGISPPVDRLKSLGNAIVPQVAEWIGRRLMKLEALK